jgi:hypothetical protein
MGSQENPLYPQAPANTAWRDTASIGGFRDNDLNLAAGYRRLADIGARQWQVEAEAAGCDASSFHRLMRRYINDHTVVPILNAYRHSIELALKVGIRGAAACARGDGVTDPEGGEQEIDDFLASTHSLGCLVEHLRHWLSCLKGARLNLSPTTAEVLDALHLIDETGQVFRYSTVKQGGRRVRRLVPARPDEQNFDFRATATALSEAADELLSNLDGMLDQYADYQMNRDDDAGQNEP